MAISNPTDLFLVNRNDISYYVTQANLMAQIKDDDLMLVNRADVSYKITGLEAKESFADPLSLTVTISPEDPVVGIVETATAIPSGGRLPVDGFVYTYQWKTSTNLTTTVDIPNATARTYTPTQSNNGLYLACTVSTTDALGTSVTATAFTVSTVLLPTVAPVINTVTLTDPESNANRFTDAVFPYTVNLSTDGTPAPTYALKAKLNGTTFTFDSSSANIDSVYNTVPPVITGTKGGWNGYDGNLWDAAQTFDALPVLAANELGQTNIGQGISPTEETIDGTTLPTYGAGNRGTRGWVIDLGAVYTVRLQAINITYYVCETTAQSKGTGVVITGEDVTVTGRVIWMDAPGVPGLFSYIAVTPASTAELTLSGGKDLSVMTGDIYMIDGTKKTDGSNEFEPAYYTPVSSTITNVGDDKLFTFSLDSCSPLLTQYGGPVVGPVPSNFSTYGPGLIEFAYNDVPGSPYFSFGGSSTSSAIATVKVTTVFTFSYTNGPGVFNYQNGSLSDGSWVAAGDCVPTSQTVNGLQYVNIPIQLNQASGTFTLTVTPSGTMDIFGFGGSKGTSDIGLTLTNSNDLGYFRVGDVVQTGYDFVSEMSGTPQDYAPYNRIGYIGMWDGLANTSCGTASTQSAVIWEGTINFNSSFAIQNYNDGNITDNTVTITHGSGNTVTQVMSQFPASIRNPVGSTPFPPLTTLTGITSPVTKIVFTATVGSYIGAGQVAADGIVLGPDALITSIKTTSPYSIVTNGGSWSGSDGSGNSSGQTVVTGTSNPAGGTITSKTDSAPFKVTLAPVTGRWIGPNSSAKAFQFTTVIPSESSASTVYCQMQIIDDKAEVMGIQTTDPGFLNVTAKDYDIEFPTLFTSGVAPDTALPTGAALTATVKASNEKGHSVKESNVIMPAVIAPDGSSGIITATGKATATEVTNWNQAAVWSNFLYQTPEGQAKAQVTGNEAKLPFNSNVSDGYYGVPGFCTFEPTTPIPVISTLEYILTIDATTGYTIRMTLDGVTETSPTITGPNTWFSFTSFAGKTISASTPLKVEWVRPDGTNANASFNSLKVDNLLLVDTGISGAVKVGTYNQTLTVANNTNLSTFVAGEAMQMVDDTGAVASYIPVSSTITNVGASPSVTGVVNPNSVSVNGSLANLFSSSKANPYAGAVDNLFYGASLDANTGSVTLEFAVPFTGDLQIWANAAAAAVNPQLSCNGTSTVASVESRDSYIVYYNLGQVTNATTITFSGTSTLNFWGILLDGANFFPSAGVKLTVTNDQDLEFFNVGDIVQGNPDWLHTQVFSNNAAVTGSLNFNAWWPANPATFQFDADITNYSQANGQGGTCKVTQTFNPPISCNTDVKILGGLTNFSNGATISINGGAGVQISTCAGTNPAYTDVSTLSFSGSISSIVIDQPVEEAGLLIFGYVIDGRRLVDSTVTDPLAITVSTIDATSTPPNIAVSGGKWAGSDNTGDPAWNKSQEWSNGADGNRAAYPVTNAFNGSLTTYAYAEAAQVITVTLLGGSISLTSLRVYTDSITNNAAVASFFVNGNNYTSQLQQGGGWNTITGETQITSIGYSSPDINNIYTGLSAVEVNGQILVNTSVSGGGGEAQVTGPSKSGNGLFVSTNGTNNINLTETNLQWISNDNRLSKPFFAKPLVTALNASNPKHVALQQAIATAFASVPTNAAPALTGDLYRLLAGETLTANELATLTDRLTAATHGDRPFHLAGYYPLYYTAAGANAASPSNSSHTHVLEGNTYYMPDGVTIYHGNYVPEVTSYTVSPNISTTQSSNNSGSSNSGGGGGGY